MVATAWRRRDRLGEIWGGFQERGTGSLWIAALVLGLARQFEIPGVEPQGYWPRWAMIGSFMAFDLGLLIELAPLLNSPKRRWTTGVFATAGWLALVVFGIAVTWYHRPLARLKEIVPDRIYISTMPGAAASRSPRAAITSAPSSTSSRRRPPTQSPAGRRVGLRQGERYPLPDEPGRSIGRRLQCFLERDTGPGPGFVGLADPRALPRLHGSFTRLDGDLSVPGAGASAESIMQEIERHRGYRPKASVILLYNRVLPPRAGARYWSDPTAILLRRCGESPSTRRRIHDRSVDPPSSASARPVASDHRTR